uniref:pulmonary surfactant-associated protein C n=1 Tax=Euleptes europaea TaxID=460621 RepID=UPI002540BB2E|nr:pulmonary surfactant-associated protein C [Euleptes europaea]
MMATDGKEVLLMEAPPDYTASPRFPGLPCKKLLIVVVVVVVIVLVVLGFLLMGLHITEKHTETVLQMTIQGLDGEGPLQHLSMTRKERMATFHARVNGNTSATVVYDYSNLLIGYRPWPGQSCYITKMNKENIQSLDAIIKAFQQVQSKPITPPHQQTEKEEGFPVLLTNRSLLSTTVNILCSSVPIYWA